MYLEKHVNIKNNNIKDEVKIRKHREKGRDCAKEEIIGSDRIGPVLLDSNLRFQ